MKAQPPIPFNHRLRQHPNSRELALNPNYFQDRMLASVARPSTVAGETAMIRGFAEQTDGEVRELRGEVSELRRSLAGLQAQRAGNDDGAPSVRNYQDNAAKPQIRGRVVA